MSHSFDNIQMNHSLNESKPNWMYEKLNYVRQNKYFSSIVTFFIVFFILYISNPYFVRTEGGCFNTVIAVIVSLFFAMVAWFISTRTS